jgi:hypothetical protein
VTAEIVQLLDLRTSMVQFMRTMTIGPIAPDEILRERASDRYHVGMLAPAGTEIDKEEDDFERGGSDADDGEKADDTFSLANAAQQGAVGITVILGTEEEIQVSWSWASYLPVEIPDEARAGWKRVPEHGAAKVRPAFGPTRTDAVVHERDGIRIVATMRLAGAAKLLTISVLNLRTEPDKKITIGDREVFPDHSIYQVGLELQLAKPGFTAQRGTGRIADEEFEMHELLYRHARQFGVGHGCAADWEAAPDATAASRVWIEWMPATEVRKASTAILKGAPWLKVERLAMSGEQVQVCAELRGLPQAYREWVKQRRADLVSEQKRGLLTPERVAIGEKNLDRCNDVAARIETGIDLLAGNDVAWRAFTLANEATALGMRKSRPTHEPEWRAFQIAFILMALPSVADPKHPERDLLELIWFATGGGKTEAYLGIAMFCLFHRRLAAGNPDKGAGTAVITRYTLRLLTIQQFERTAKAVLAAELARRRMPQELGTTPFSVGLFVGNKATPGTFDEATKNLRGEGDGTTLPLGKCPWCGTTLSKSLQHVDRTAKRLITPCPGKGCEFGPGLPLSVVDEEIYEHPPSMVVATLDKFAMMAWRPEISSMFGAGKYPPPGLIIQDELHLIGDSLGTIAALYEIAIDYLCSVNGIRPKIVGSTATIRRAHGQVKMLFNRGLAQFPPHGTDARDSFFSRSDIKNPGRLYVGVHAQGRSPKHTLARLMGLLAQAPLMVAGNAVLEDQYTTLVAYFNSLRELGGAIVLAEDDTRQYIDSLPPRPGGMKWRHPRHIEELTSHRRSEEIPVLLEQMKVGLPGTDEAEPLDLVLATNMISVGVDVDRLGLMVVNGQPKTTAEYIQASSRVGRPDKSAGLVVTLYNWTRPRDRSHYERFRTYHESFYRFVEATSVTPFSDRALDRALHGALASMVRQSVATLADNPSAGLIKRNENHERVMELMKIIVERAVSITDSQEISDRVSSFLEHLVDAEWRVYADGESLNWAGTSKNTGLLLPPNAHHSNRGKWKTLMSMRDVEPDSPVRAS